MQAVIIPLSNNFNFLNPLIMKILQVSNTHPAQVDMNVLSINLHDLYLTYGRNITPLKFSVYIYYYVKHFGIQGLFDDEINFHEIKESANARHANEINFIMGQAGGAVECRCGTGLPHLAQLNGNQYIRCQMGIDVKVVYDATINTLDFLAQRTSFTPGQCYTRRIILFNNRTWYFVDEEETVFETWKNIENSPTCPYDINDPEMIYERIRVAGPSHKQLLFFQRERQRGNIVPEQGKYQEDLCADPEEVESLAEIEIHYEIISGEIMD